MEKQQTFNSGTDIFVFYSIQLYLSQLQHEP